VIGGHSFHSSFRHFPAPSCNSPQHSRHCDNRRPRWMRLHPSRNPRRITRGIAVPVCDHGVVPPRIRRRLGGRDHKLAAGPRASSTHSARPGMLDKRPSVHVNMRDVLRQKYMCRASAAHVSARTPTSLPRTLFFVALTNSFGTTDKHTTRHTPRSRHNG
jgi:hypothetical protein